MKSALVWSAGLAAFGSAVTATAPPLQTFPIPQSITLGSDTRPLAAGFKIDANTSASPNLQEIVTRYEKIFGSAVTSPKLRPGRAEATADEIEGVRLAVESTDETLDNTTNTSYSIKLGAGDSVVTISSATSYGAMYGLETLSQLVASSEAQMEDSTPLSAAALPSTVEVEDHPSLGYRGLTIDVGRRISPLSLLQNTVQAMSFSKMNVLHLSLSGPVVRLEIKAYPELTAGLTSDQYYTQEQMKEFVTYAQSHGVRVIPEIDIPAHASGLRPLQKTQGLTFCDGDTASTIGDTPENLKCVNTIYDEVVSVFSDPWVHIGGDEVVESTNGTGCSVKEIQTVETSVQERLISVHNKIPMGWNEVYSVPTATVPNAAIPGTTILQNWKDATNAATTGAGFLTLDSTYQQFYLNEQCCRVAPPSATEDPFGRYTECYWIDVLDGLTAKEIPFMAGGAAAMWSDNYCPSPVCATNGSFGWMYPPEQDAIFIQSFSKSIWPKASAAGAAFWNFDSTVQATSDDLQKRLDLHNTRLINRGIISCGNNCTCDWGYDCGKPYGGKPTPLNVEITFINNAGANLNVKERTACDKRNGDTLLQIQKGQSGTLRGKNFIVEAGGGLAGDPFDLWIGDGTWMDLNLTLSVTNAGGGYLAYTIV